MEHRARATGQQFALMLEFMESHGDLAKPQAGAQGRLRSERLWLELTTALNAIGGGVQKTSDKWKKVWADWKSKTKKKSLIIRQHAGGTGGGPNSRLTLTVFEERVLALLGSVAVEGDHMVEEQGIDLTPQNSSGNVEVLNFLVPSTSQSQPGLARTPSAQPSPLPLSPPPRQSPTPRQPPPTRHSPPPQQSPPPPQPLLNRPAPTSPRPTTRRRRRAPQTPNSSMTSPRRQYAHPRRRRALTPFDRATSEFVDVELRRLDLEEIRERNEARRIDVAQEMTRVLNRFADIAQMFVNNYFNH